MYIPIVDLRTIVGRKKTSHGILTYCFLPWRLVLATFIWLHPEPPWPSEGLAMVSGNPLLGEELGVCGGDWEWQYFPSSLQTTCIYYHLHSVLLSIFPTLDGQFTSSINLYKRSEANHSQLKPPRHTPSKNSLPVFRRSWRPLLTLIKLAEEELNRVDIFFCYPKAQTQMFL